MKTLEKPEAMEAHSNITVANAIKLISTIYDYPERRKEAILDIVLEAYKKRHIGKMEAADLLGLDYYGITELLHKRGIPSQMGLPDDLEKVAKKNMEKLITDFKTESQ